jgi:hypothetical protein
MAEVAKTQGGSQQPSTAASQGATQPTSTQGTPSSQAGSQQPSQQPMAWESDSRFKGKTAEDVWNAYRNAESQIGQMGQYKTFADQVNQYAQQFGGLENLLNAARYGLEQYQRAAQHQQPNQGQQQQPQAWIENWDVMTPQQQATVLQQVVTSQALQQIQPYAQQIADQIRNELRQEYANQARQWDIYQKVLPRALEIQQQNPALGMQQILQNMVQLAQSGPDALMDLAINSMTQEQRMKAQAEALAQAKIADFQQQEKNRQLASLTSVRPGPANGRGEPAVPLNSIERKRNILSTLISEGKINPNQV